MGRPTKEFQAFDHAMRRILTVSKTILDQRVAEYREKAAQNPNKRGPKPKATRAASRAPGA